MNGVVDIRVVELLCSRICHDLIGPVTAINNGVELVTEMGAEMGDDALDLIAHSAEQASRRLAFLRLAYGAAGSEGAVDISDTREAALDFYKDSKIELDWPGNLSAAGLPPGMVKLLLNVVLLAGETVGQGGTIKIVRDQGNEVLVTATGKVAQMREGAAEALAGKLGPTELSPRSVHPFMVTRFAEHFGLKVAVDGAASTRVDFRISAGA